MKQTIGELIRFGIVGVVATLTQYAIYFVMVHFHIGPNISYAVSYGLSFVGNMLLTSLFTFRTRLTLKRGAGFGGVHLFNLILQMVLLNLFIYLGVPKVYAPLPVYAIAIPLQFILVRYVFKKV